MILIYATQNPVRQFGSNAEEKTRVEIWRLKLSSVPVSWAKI